MSLNTGKKIHPNTTNNPEVIDFPTQVSQLLADHAEDDQDPMVMGCSNLTEMSRKIGASQDKEKATKQPAMNSSPKSSSSPLLEIDDFEIISHAEVTDYGRKVTAARGWKAKDVLENMKLYGLVLAWSGMKCIY